MTKMTLFLCIYLVSISSLLAKSNKIVLGVTEQTLNSSRGQFSKVLYSKLLEKLNYELEVKVFPSIRLAERVKVKQIDGELIRMSNYGKKHTYLTRVDEPTFTFTLALYGTLQNLGKTDWSNLKDKKYVYRRGVKVVEMFLLNVAKTEKLFSFPSTEKGLKLVSLGRFDGYVGVEYLTDEILKKQPKEIRDNIEKVKKLKSDAAHLFLGEKYSHLADKIAKELRKMKKSGEYKKIQKSI